MKKILVLFLLLVQNPIFSQFCETFNQYSDESHASTCPQIEYNALNNWDAVCSTLGYNDFNGIDGHYLYLVDQPSTTGSWVFNNVDFSGDWSQGLQFSYDFILLDGGQASSTTGSFYIYNGSDPLTSNLVARFVLNNPVSINDGWTTITPPIGLMSQGNPPSNNTGYWEMVNGTDWDYLIQNVTGLAFNLDINNGGEAYGLDNICMEECDLPFDDLFSDFPTCYYDLPYVTSDDFLNYLYECEINGVTVMDFFTGYLDPQYFNNGSFIINTPGEYIIEMYFENCYMVYELEIFPEILINLPSTFVSCNNVYEEICAPYGQNYTYQWYGPTLGGNTSELLSEEICFTPELAGYYNLVVTDANGCSKYHNFSVLEETPLPILGQDGEICIGELVSIADQGFDNPNFIINWYHNDILVQSGGEVLQTQFIEGTITVEVSYSPCHPVSVSVNLKECCPKNLSLEVDCEAQDIYIENFPTNVAGGTSSWYYNGNYITPQLPFTSYINANQGDGIYRVIMNFELSNGEQCKFVGEVEYSELNCCDELTAAVTLVSNAHPINPPIHVEETPYGPMDVEVMDCDFIIDGSASTCEDAYQIIIEPWNPGPWTGNGEIYNEWFSGIAPSSISVPPGVMPQGSGFYLLTFAVGPVWTPQYVLFWYQCEEPDALYNPNGDSRELLEVETQIALTSNPHSDIQDLLLVEEQILVYPNPTSTRINLKTRQNSANYQLFDINGNILLQQKIQQRNTSIDLSKFHAGIYFLRIQNESGEVHIKKVIKN